MTLPITHMFWAATRSSTLQKVCILTVVALLAILSTPNLKGESANSSVLVNNENDGEKSDTAKTKVIELVLPSEADLPGRFFLAPPRPEGYSTPEQWRVWENAGQEVNRGKHKIQMSVEQELNFRVEKLLTDQQLANLGTVKTLNVLVLMWCRYVTNDGLKVLKHLDDLTCLKVVDCHKIDDEGLSHASSLTSLTNLNLAFSGRGRISDKSAKIIGTFTKLRKLVLAGCEAITDVGVAELGNLTNLTYLSLEETGISDQAILSLKSMTALQSLDIGGCSKLGDKATEHLKTLTTICELRITGEKLTDVGVKNLESLAALKELDLSDTSVTNSGIESLMKLKKIERIILLRCANISNDCLTHFTTITTLKYVCLNGCKQITMDAVARLRKEIPKVVVEFLLEE